jgi:hypothetical protein
MAGIIRELAPHVPIHTKAMSTALLWRHTIAWGTEPERFGRFSNMSGNDCWMWPVPEESRGGWATNWTTQNMAYDLQRSVTRMPVFNSENHLSPDRSTFYIDPNHFRTALWQGAIHGQAATTIWVWERSFDRGSDFYGNVMDRPGCAQAVGETCLDLNRCAAEVAALQNAPADVAMVYSIASTAKDGNYLPNATRMYEALNFCGVKIDFISEAQLARGAGKQYKMIVCPSATHMTSASFSALTELPDSVRLVISGHTPHRTPYGGRFAESEVERLRTRALRISASTTDTREIRDMLFAELERIGAGADVLLAGFDGKPVWGIEWLPVAFGDRTIFNAVNLTGEPRDVRIMRRTDAGWQQARGMDLLSWTGPEEVRTLQPLRPVLARLE